MRTIDHALRGSSDNIHTRPSDGVASVALGIRCELDGTMWWSMLLLGLLAVVTAFIPIAQDVLCACGNSAFTDGAARNSLKVLQELAREFADDD